MISTPAAGTTNLERGLFRAEAVKRLFAEHRAGHRDHGNRIWRLLNLELWFRVFADGEPCADGLARSRGAYRDRVS